MHEINDTVPSVGKPLRDRSKWIRPAVQFGFVLFSILLGLEFHGFVRALQNPAVTSLHRPSAVEAYLPISSLMSLVYFCKTGILNNVHPAGLVIFTLTLLLALAVRRGFCSWVCPIGTGAEYAWKTGRRIFGRNLTVPKWIDIPLRLLKYLLLGFFVYQILLMPSEGLRQFIYGSYNRIADVKMYLFFKHITITGAVVLAVLGVLSVLIKNFWCRYLCPYGALLGVFSVASPVAVRRDEKTCTACGRCAKSCPNRIPVDRKAAVRSTLCTACYSCVQACRVPGAIKISAAKKKWTLSVVSYALITVLVLLLTAQVAKTFGYWHSSTPAEYYRMLLQNIHQIGHP